MTAIAGSGLPLTTTEFGAGPPVVILHGLFGSGTNWRRIATALSDTFHVLTPDQRNHGGSPWEDAMTYPAMATDLCRFVDERSLGPIRLMGHSMGGKVAMQFTLADPARVHSLVVADIAPVTYDHSHLPLIDAMRFLDLDRVGSRADASAALTAAIPEAGVRQFLLQNLVQQDGRWRWRINLDVLAKSMGALADFPEPGVGATYHGPALFLHGGNSPYVKPEHRASIERWFPNATVVSVPGAGHWLHAEQPEIVIGHVREWFSR